MGLVQGLTTAGAEESGVAVAEHAAVGGHQPVAPAVGRGRHADDGLVQGLTTAGAEEFGVAIAEDTAVRCHQPVAPAVGRGRHADDRLVQGLAAAGAEEPGVAVVEDTAVGRRQPVATSVRSGRAPDDRRVERDGSGRSVGDGVAKGVDGTTGGEHPVRLPPDAARRIGQRQPFEGRDHLIGGEDVPGRGRADPREGEGAGYRNPRSPGTKAVPSVGCSPPGRRWGWWATAPEPARPGSPAQSSRDRTSRDCRLYSGSRPIRRRRPGRRSGRPGRSSRPVRSVRPAQRDPGSPATWCSCPHSETRHQWDPGHTEC